MFEASLLGYPICEASVYVGVSSFSRASTFAASVQDRPARVLVLWSLCVSDTGFTAEVSREGLRLSSHSLLIQDRDGCCHPCRAQRREHSLGNVQIRELSVDESCGPLGKSILGQRNIKGER